MPRKRSVNQAEIARRLQISRTTVSRSLSNHPAISAVTRAKVQAMAASLGYRHVPTRVIRSGRQGRSITIGVVIGVPACDTAMATFPMVLRGIQERAQVDHVAVDVVTEDPSVWDPRAARQPLFRRIRERRWRGLILMYPFPPESVDQIARRISTVSVLSEYDHLAVDTVDTDHADIAGMVRHLAAAGHERIGFVSWRYRVGGRWALRRFGAFAEGMFQLGLELRADWVANIHRESNRCETPEAVAAFVAQRLRRDGVTAWVCAADHQAYQLIGDLRAVGIEVPRDCSVTGFDGIAPPPGMPRLTTLGVAHEDIGSSAVARLLSRILHPTAPRRKILVETRLVEGGTVGPPGAVGNTDL